MRWLCRRCEPSIFYRSLLLNEKICRHFRRSGTFIVRIWSTGPKPTSSARARICITPFTLPSGRGKLSCEVWTTVAIASLTTKTARTWGQCKARWRRSRFRSGSICCWRRGRNNVGMREATFSQRRWHCGRFGKSRTSRSTFWTLKLGADYRLLRCFLVRANRFRVTGLRKSCGRLAPDTNDIGVSRFAVGARGPHAVADHAAHRSALIHITHACPPAV